MRKLIHTLVGTAAVAFSTQLLAVPITTDIISVVDESGSMRGEHLWLGGMISDLDSALATEAGTDTLSARYGLVGFGGSSSSGHLLGHQHDVNGGEFGTASQFNTATSTLVLNGGTEDGYSGINTALGYGLRSNAVTNLILVTDEDRDVADGSLTYANTLSAMTNINALLNAVLNVNISCGDGSVALGLDASGTGYKSDGAGGFTTCSGATAADRFSSQTSVPDYVDLALATGGAAWDLNQLRAGGLTATSFTNAFVDIKVEETIRQTVVPEPGSLALLGLGLAGLGLVRRRRTS